VSNTIQEIDTALQQAPDGSQVGVIVAGTTFTVARADLAKAMNVQLPAHVTALATIVGNLNLRSSPAIDPNHTKANILESMPDGMTVEVLDNGKTTAGSGYNFLHIKSATGQVGYAAQYVSGVLTIKPFVATPPTVAHKVIGFHYINDGAAPTPDALIALAKRMYDAHSPIAVATIVDHPGLCVSLSQYVDVVIHRNVEGANDPQPQIPNNEADAIAYGKQWVVDRLGKTIDLVDHGVVIQYANEVGFQPFDYAFYLGVMQKCDELQHKAAIFADSVGTPEPEQWVQRIPALTYAKAHGHFVANHAYGRSDSPNAPVSDPIEAAYYGLRYRRLYAAVPESARPDLIISECGTFAANFVGIDALLADMQAFNAEIVADPYVRGACWWTLGGTKADGWERSEWASALPAYEKWLTTGRYP
jgi:hypothetical protein